MRDWQGVHADADIQFAPIRLAAPKPPVTPGWLEALGRFLKRLLGPIAEAIGLSWPVLSYIMLGLALLAALVIVWRLVSPLLMVRRKAPAEGGAPWMPDRAAAQALLEDADRLAAQGRYDEAAHLVLMRSVADIAAARPDWLHPASTAREIACLPGLAVKARAAFAQIAQLVERSRFALHPLAAADWQAVRAAYADFALAGVAG